MAKSFTFQSITDQFKTKSQYEKFIAESQTIYELKVYRVNTMSRQQAIDYYSDLKNKYDTGIYQSTGTSWHQNERRLFIWFLICYIKFSGIKSLACEENWQTLSAIFFQKDIRLLQYQYNSILKRTGRVTWTEQQDDILRQAYHKYEHGEWNEIAKELFFSQKSTQFKNPKHCRERWNNHLNSQVKKDPWTDEEDLEMLNLVRSNGKKWSLLAKLFKQRRTQHQIKNRYNSLISHAQKQQSEEDVVQSLIASYNKKRQSSKFAFFNNIIVVKEEEKQVTPVFQNKEFEPSQEKRQHVTSGGMSIIFCGNRNQSFDRSMTTAIEDKLFGSTSQFLSDIKSENLWMDKSIVHTPGHHFFDDSSSTYERKMGDFKFKLESKGSFDKSQIAASMEFLKLPRSDISQEFKILSSSSSDLRTGINYDFSNDIKQI